jgi:hypothetical protein
MQHQRHPLNQRGGNGGGGGGGGGGYDSVRALNSISYSNSIEDEKHDGDDDDDDDDDSVVDSAIDGEEYSDALSGGYGDDGDDDDDEGDLDSEAREYYNSGASELVTTVRSVHQFIHVLMSFGGALFLSRVVLPPFLYLPPPRGHIARPC